MLHLLSAMFSHRNSPNPASWGPKVELPTSNYDFVPFVCFHHVYMVFPKCLELTNTLMLAKGCGEKKFTNEHIVFHSMLSSRDCMWFALRPLKNMFCMIQIYVI